MSTLPFLLHLVPAVGPVPWCSWPLRIDMFSSLKPSTCILGQRSLKSFKHMTTIHPWPHQLHQFPSSQCASDTSVCGNSVKLVLMLVLCSLWLIDGLHDASSMWLHDSASPSAFAYTQHGSHLFSSLKYTRCPPLCSLKLVRSCPSRLFIKSLCSLSIVLFHVLMAHMIDRL